ncbi:MAG: hypothetical protein NUV80_06620 [Candidatus Berkelbacteria bacterium]|nr:hypothetical protein [Candidatus Berkelbacteria bacterium]
MKPVNSYKTIAAMKADLKKEGVRLDRTGGALEKIKLASKDWWMERPRISCYQQQNNFCCAFKEIGGFSLNDELDKYWPYLLRAQLSLITKGYTRCSTLDGEDWEELNNALLEVGFLPVTSVKSNHGNYNALLWEWFKK